MGRSRAGLRRLRGRTTEPAAAQRTGRRAEQGEGRERHPCARAVDGGCGPGGLARGNVAVEPRRLRLHRHLEAPARLPRGLAAQRQRPPRRLDARRSPPGQGTGPRFELLLIRSRCRGGLDGGFRCGRARGVNDRSLGRARGRLRLNRARRDAHRLGERWLNRSLNRRSRLREGGCRDRGGGRRLSGLGSRDRGSLRLGGLRRGLARGRRGRLRGGRGRGFRGGRGRGLRGGRRGRLRGGRERGLGLRL